VHELVIVVLYASGELENPASALAITDFFLSLFRFVLIISSLCRFIKNSEYLVSQCSFFVVKRFLDKG
jgi:hypothetical protein